MRLFYYRNKMDCLHFIAIFLIMAFISCKKTGYGDNSSYIPDMFPDYVTKVTSTVSGFVSNENDMPVVGANVKCGIATVSTDRYGYFEFKNVEVIKDAATVTVTYQGYFKSIKTYTAIENKQVFLRIKLLPRTIIGTINASTGGRVSSPEGLNISFPADAIKNASTGFMYSGTVTVAAIWIDPTSNELHKIMPGDLRGINADGAIKSLTTYGMAAVELTGSSGENLQIAVGKKASLSFPLPAISTASAPASIPLWYFVEESGLWKEEGVAVKTGNTYVGEVSHFTFWNCDIPGSFVKLSATVSNSAGVPIPNVLVRLRNLSNTTNNVGAYTSNDGFVSGRVPVNANILVEVLLENAGCTTPFLTKQINTGTVDISLGNIKLPDDSKVAVIKGSVLDCNNNLVQNGYVMVKNGNVYSKHYVSAGAYDFSTLICENNVIMTLLAEDITGARQSNPINKNISQGENVVAALQACDVSTEVYCYFKINNDEYSLTPGSIFAGCNLSEITADSARNSVDIQISLLQNGVPTSAIGQTGDLQIYWYSYGASPLVNGPHFLYSINPYLPVNGPVLSISILPKDYNSNFKTFPIHITEYGNVGQFVSGSFSGTLYETNGAESILVRPYNVSCNFRVRRHQ